MVKPFLDVFKDVTAKASKVKKQNYQEYGDIPVVDQGKKQFGGYADKLHKVCGIQLPAIVFGDHTRVFKYIEEDFALGADGVKLLQPKVESNSKYLYWYLTQLQLENAGYSRHFKYLKETHIPLPPLKTQKYIASVLEKADQLRKDCQRLEQELNQLAQSVFIEMFGDPVTNPMGWKTLNLLDVCTKITDGTHQSPEWADNGIPFLFISNIHKGNINFNTNKFITNTCYEKLTKTTKIEPNDILYTTVGSYGRVALVKESHPEFCFQRHIAHIKPDSKKILPKFLYYQLQTTGIKFFADKYAKGIAQKTLNLKDLKNFKILVPPQEKQKQQIVLMQNIHSQYEMLEQQDADYETLFNTLSQKAFKGELKAPA